MELAATNLERVVIGRWLRSEWRWLLVGLVVGVAIVLGFWLSVHQEPQRGDGLDNDRRAVGSTETDATEIGSVSVERDASGETGKRTELTERARDLLRLCEEGIAIPSQNP